MFSTEFLFFAAGYIWGLVLKAVYYAFFIGTLAFYLWPITVSLVLGIYFIRKAHKSSLN